MSTLMLVVGVLLAIVGYCSSVAHFFISNNVFPRTVLLTYNLDPDTFQ
jgi:hypothetical protein